jgi:hypothetical protein
LYTGLLNGYLDYINKFAEVNKQIEFINLQPAQSFEKVQDLLVSQLFENYELITILKKKIEIVL